MSLKSKVEIEGEVVHETEKAILFNVDGIEEWVPKSQIEEEDFDAGDSMTITIPEWLAKIKGWEERADGRKVDSLKSLDDDIPF